MINFKFTFGMGLTGKAKEHGSLIAQAAMDSQYHLLGKGITLISLILIVQAPSCTGKHFCGISYNVEDAE